MAMEWTEYFNNSPWGFWLRGDKHSNYIHKRAPPAYTSDDKQIELQLIVQYTAQNCSIYWSPEPGTVQICILGVPYTGSHIPIRPPHTRSDIQTLYTSKDVTHFLSYIYIYECWMSIFWTSSFFLYMLTKQNPSTASEVKTKSSNKLSDWQVYTMQNKIRGIHSGSTNASQIQLPDWNESDYGKA